MSLSKNIYPSLVLVQPRKTRPFITERLLIRCKELNQTNKQKAFITVIQMYVDHTGEKMVLADDFYDIIILNPLLHRLFSDHDIIFYF